MTAAEVETAVESSEAPALETTEGLVLASDDASEEKGQAAVPVATMVRALEAMHAGSVPELPGLDLPDFGELVVRRDEVGRTVVASGSLRQWERVAQALAELPVERAGEWISRNGEAISRVLPGGEERFRLLLVSTARRLAELELPAEKPELTSRGLRWVPVDPALRQLGPLDRHLVLMSRRDAERIQKVCARLADELEDSATASIEALPPLDLGSITTAAILEEVSVDEAIVED